MILEFCNEAKAGGLFKLLVEFHQLFKMLKQKNLKILLILAQFLKSGFLHFGNTKTEADLFLPKPP
jgi:hypothetical protein